MDLDDEELKATKQMKGLNKFIINSAFDDLETIFKGLLSQCKNQEMIDCMIDNIEGLLDTIETERREEIKC